MASLPDSSLFDIKPATATVVAGGIRHEIVGVPFGVFLKIGMMWPPLIGLLQGQSIDHAQFAAAPDAVAQFIAAGFGLPGNSQAIDKANGLPLDIQMELFAGILGATLGGGAGPFARKLSVINALMTPEADAKSPTSSSGSSASAEGMRQETPSNSGRKPSIASSVSDIVRQ